MAIDLDKNKNNSSGNPYSKQDVDRAEQITYEARSLTEELKDQLGIRSRVNETDKAQLNLSREIQRSAALNTVELGNQDQIGRQIIKDQKTLLAVQREKLTVSKSISKDQATAARKIVINQSKALRIQEELETASQAEAEILYEKLGLIDEEVAKQSKIAGKEGQRYALLLGMESTSKKILKDREAEAKIQTQINDKMGVAGALVKGTGALMERLGMRSGIFNDAMKASKEEMQKMAEESTRIVKTVDENGNIVEKTLENYSKTQIMAAGISKLLKGFGKALFDPFTILTAIFKAFLAVNKAAVEFTRLTGQGYGNLSLANTEASNLVDLLVTASELTKQTGLNAAAIFSPDQIGQLSDAKNLLGISADQAANLGMMMKLTGESADQLGNSIYDNVDAGVSQKMVYDDVLSASKDIVASAGGNTEELGRAASAARKLGLDLAKVNKIADGLMDFESSISAELEAQLLTGKNINLSKARELALNNDLEGVARELEKNGASAAEYAKMNRLQQESLAKALGMSREQLGNMVLTEEALADMTAEQRAQARGVTLEQSKQMDIQARIQKSLSTIAQSFAPILEGISSILLPIIDGVSFIVNSIKTFAGVLAGTKDTMSEMQKIVASLAIGFGVMKVASVIIANQAKIAEMWAKRRSIWAVVTATADMMGASAKSFGIAAGFGLAAAGLAYGFLSSKAKQTGDLKINPNGGPIVASPKEGGIFQGTKNDELRMGPTKALDMATQGGGNQTSTSSTIQGEGKTSLGVDMRKVEAKLDQLISVISAGGDVFLDGNKVGSALVLGSYKSS
jgi:hypothetical protein